MKRQRVTLVTGSRSGIGRAVAALLKARGERVIGLDIADADIAVDLSAPDGRHLAVQRARALACDGLDAVIACAGLASNDGSKTVAVNYFAVTEVLEGLHQLLAAAPHPRAVVVASSSNILPVDEELVEACLSGDERVALAFAQDNPLAYASSKRAITRWIRRTSILPGWVDRNLLLNGVAPGLVRTAMTADLLASKEGQAMLARSVPHATPDVADPDSIAPLLAFLASRDNLYMVGQVPFCDGGSDVLLRGDDILKSITQQ